MNTLGSYKVSYYVQGQLLCAPGGRADGDRHVDSASGAIDYFVRFWSMRQKSSTRCNGVTKRMRKME
jgi:hypothetical protein